MLFILFLLLPASTRNQNLMKPAVTLEVCDNWLCSQSLYGLYVIKERVFFAFYFTSNKPEFIFCGSSVARKDYSCKGVTRWALPGGNNKTPAYQNKLFVRKNSDSSKNINSASGPSWFLLSVRRFSFRGNFILFLCFREAPKMVLVLWICIFWSRQIIICRIQQQDILVLRWNDHILHFIL